MLDGMFKGICLGEVLITQSREKKDVANEANN